MTAAIKKYHHEPNIWSHTYRIRSHEVEPGGRLSLPTLFHLMQDGASSHAKALGLSVSELMTTGYTWVLSRLVLNILAPLPEWEDQIDIQTWPSGNKGPFALRDIIFKNKSGQTIAAALSGWLVISTDTRKPQRIGAYSKMLRPMEGHHVLSQNLEKVPALNRIDHERQFSVRRRDLDINQHVNNVCYMDWLLETLPDAIIQQMQLKTIVLNFMGEAGQNDQVTSTVEANIKESGGEDAAFLHRIYRQCDQQELFKAKSVWEVRRE